MEVERPLKVARSSTKLPRSSICRSFFARKDLCAFNKADFQLSTLNEGSARGLELFSLEMLESAEASGEHTNKVFRRDAGKCTRGRVRSPDPPRSPRLSVRFSEMIHERCSNKAVNNEF